MTGPGQGDHKDSAYATRSVQRAIDIITSFSGEKPEQGLSELAAHLGLHKSTAHRLINVLAGSGLLERNPHNGKYRLSLKFFELGSLVMDQMDIRREALPHLQDLSARIGETVHLVIRDYNEAIYIEKVERPNTMVRYSRIGKRIPLHCTAVGKVLLAALPEWELADLLSKCDLSPRTSMTITCPVALMEELARVRTQGYAVDDQELEEGLMCLAAPIRNHQGQVVAAISISGSPARFAEGHIEAKVAELIAAANNISISLGYRG